ncbi:MAG: hypothetical protein Fur005_29740 [Roseiflexaceae bacterium]
MPRERLRPVRHAEGAPATEESLLGDERFLAALGMTEDDERFLAALRMTEDDERFLATLGMTRMPCSMTVGEGLIGIDSGITNNARMEPVCTLMS